MSVSSFFYAVTGARRSGIFTSWSRVLDATVGYPGAKVKKFSTLAEAEEFMKSKSTSNQVSSGWDGPAYAVAVGRRMGIFRTHEEAYRQTFRYSGSSWKQFASYEGAIAFLDHHNWRKMALSDGDAEVVATNEGIDDISDAKTNVTTLEEGNPQDTSRYEVTVKRERDEAGHSSTAEVLRPVQRRRVHKEQDEKEDILVFCHGFHAQDNEDGVTVKLLCSFPLRPEWDVLQTLCDPTTTTTRAGILAVLKVLERAARQDPTYAVNEAISTIHRSLFNSLRKWAHNGWQSGDEDQDLLKCIAEKKRGRQMKLSHLDGSVFTWGADQSQQGEGNAALGG